MHRTHTYGTYFRGSSYPKKEDMYDSEQNTYLQEILLDIKPNSERESRMCYITVGSGIEELSRASIFIEQD